MTFFSRVTACCIVVSSLAATGEAARPMTIHDLLGAIRIADPQLSPDGRLVAYVRTTTDVATGRRNADIWVVAADGSAPPRLLVGGDKTETTPRWAPGGRLAFISNRDGDMQIYVAGADG